MRTVTGNIILLSNNAYMSKKLEFILCDKYENQLSAMDLDGQIATKQTVTTDMDGNFEIDLYETESAKLPMFYKMIFIENEDVDDIKLFVHKGAEKVDFLKLLSPLKNVSMFYENQNSEIVFDINVVALFERFFVNENIFINTNEKNLIEEFVKFADKKIDSDIMKKLDIYLATIGE